MKWILCCIDGTSSAKWRKRDGSNSHVFRFRKNFGKGIAGNDFLPLYLNGPNNVANATDAPAIKQVANSHIQWSIKKFFGKEAHKAKSHDYCRIVLIGHSRGGGIAIDLAAALKHQGIQVYFMGLFDAVDWSSFIAGGTVTNVKYPYHALRGLSYSRSYFGNTGTSGAFKKWFNTSHSGVGGDVVTDPNFTKGLTEDAACSTQPLMRDVYPTLRGNSAGILEVRKLTIQRVSLCISESKAAYNWIADRARHCGLPI